MVFYKKTPERIHGMKKDQGLSIDLGRFYGNDVKLKDRSF